MPKKPKLVQVHLLPGWFVKMSLETAKKWGVLKSVLR